MHISSKKYNYIVFVIALAIGFTLYIRAYYTYPKGEQLVVHLIDLFAITSTIFLLLCAVAPAIKQVFAKQKWAETFFKLLPSLFSATLLFAFTAASVSFFFLRLYSINSNQTNTNGLSSAAMANMNMGGDPSLRYTVSFTSTPAHPAPNQPTTLNFVVYNAASGQAITNYNLDMTKLLHLVIVDSSLTYFNHIHPTLTGDTFSIQTTFPKDDLYHLYLTFQPNGGTEQQMGVTLPVGTGMPSKPDPSTTALTKTVGGMNVALSVVGGGNFNYKQMNAGTQTLNFNYTDTQTGKPVTDIQPYLGAFGHLVMINEQTYTYVHVHPLPSDNSNFGGPNIQFLPAAYFDQITPGTYRVFDQFMRNNQLYVADYTVNIQ